MKKAISFTFILFILLSRVTICHAFLINTGDISLTTPTEYNPYSLYERSLFAKFTVQEQSKITGLESYFIRSGNSSLSNIDMSAEIVLYKGTKNTPSPDLSYSVEHPDTDMVLKRHDIVIQGNTIIAEWLGTSDLAIDVTPGDYWIAIGSQKSADLGVGGAVNPVGTYTTKYDTGPFISGGSKFAFRVNGVVTTPEPTTLSLLSLGLAGFLFRQRLRGKK